jgi:hypothetical protein
MRRLPTAGDMHGQAIARLSAEPESRIERMIMRGTGVRIPHLRPCDLSWAFAFQRAIEGAK